jgi:hypothetical protein
MNELFSQLFGQQPSYATALLGEEEARRLRQQAQQQGLLSVGLSLLAGSGPSAQPRGIGQLLAQGVQAGQQAYQGAYNKAVQERALMEQLAERRQAQADVQAAQQALQGAFVTREGGAAPMLDMTRLQGIIAGLTPGARSQVLKEAGAIKGAFAGPKLEKLGVEERLINPETGDVVATGAPKPREPKFTTVDVGNAIIEYMDGVEVGRKPKGRAPEGPVSLQTVETEAGLMTFNPRTGQLTPVMQDGKPVAGKGAKPTEGERNAAGFAGRMIAANQIISQPAIAAAAPGLGSGLAGSVPFVGESLRNLAQSPETQQYAQAARDWIRAKLRKESGAAIGVAEEENEFRTYFPVTGDSPRVIEQKAQARALANQGMIQAAGSAKIPEPTQPPIDLRTAAQRELERRLRGQ